MEEEEIQTQASKFSRVGNGRTGTSKLDDDTNGELKRSNLGIGSCAIGGGDSNRLRGWHHSSRIIRVSRASGGKDRHSKVWTSKGLRDRRVRLSVTTAIQFYDLQDRLGYDQPSKAVEWLIKAAADSINELPSLDGTFPDTPKQVSDEKRISDGVEQGFDSAADVELEDQDPNFNQNQKQHFSLSKSACSSTSDTSKGSGLSLSRSDARVKARERARERTAKDKEKESNPVSQNSSFTELLTCGISSGSNTDNSKAASARQWPFTPMDYFSTGLLGLSSSRATHHSSGFSGQIQLGNSIPQAMSMSMNPQFNFSGENNHNQQDQQLQHFPFLSDHLIPVAATTAQQQGPSGDYNLNFTISSSGLAGFNGGTLQSNSSSTNSLLSHLQRFSSSNSPIDTSSNVPFFNIGATAAPQSHPMDNHHHHFPPGLQLYGDGSSRHSDHKGKGKN